jgi:hypothetical protein
MWVLIIMFLTVPSNVTVLEQYELQQVCLIERDRIRVAMAEAYPGDTSFSIECLFRPKITSF